MVNLFLQGETYINPKNNIIDKGILRSLIFLLYITKDFDIFVIYNHNQNIMNMNYNPGQILWIKSSMGPWYYISVLRCAIPVERMNNAYELHTCCDLCVDADGDCLTFTRGNGSLLDFDTSFALVREATDVEREYLYKVLVKAFKDHDLGWDKHFTDSTYDDIRDWLCWEFNIELSSDESRPGPIEIAMYEIQDYIWDVLCKETGNYQEETEPEPVPEMVNTQEFIEKACKIYRKSLIKFNPALEDFPTAVDEAVNVFRKQLEE